MTAARLTTKPDALALGGLLAGALWALLSAVPALALGDGARAYLLVPEKTTIVAANAIFLDGNASLDPASAARDGRISVDVVAFQVTQSIKTGANTSGLFVILPVGAAKGSVTIDRPVGPPLRLAGKSEGLGDLQLGGVFGLVGSPSLDVRSYVARKPGFALGALARVTVPTGKYSQDQSINLGANRWAFQLGVPMAYLVGGSMLDAELMTFELLPSLTVYAENDAPFGADTRTQKPLWKVEGHVTRNLNRAIWVGVDLVASAGGSTRTDGVKDDNRQSSLELGATAGLSLSKSLSLKATYGSVVARNSNGLDGTGFRLVATGLF